MQSQMRNYVQTLSFVQVAYKIFSDWSSNPYSLTQRQFLVACSHEAPCNCVP
jgi:hypothetical protein